MPFTPFLMQFFPIFLCPIFPLNNLLHFVPQRPLPPPPPPPPPPFIPCLTVKKQVEHKAKKVFFQYLQKTIIVRQQHSQLPSCLGCLASLDGHFVFQLQNFVCVRSSQESPARHSFRQEIAARHNGIKRFLKEHSQGYRNNICTYNLIYRQSGCYTFHKRDKVPLFLSSY